MMKKILLTSLLAIAIPAVFSCSREDAAPSVADTPFDIVFTDASTRTENDGMSTRWADGDGINVFHAPAGSSDYVRDTPSGAPFTVADKAAGLFRGTLQGGLLSNEQYDWYLLYPFSAAYASPTGDAGSFIIGAAAGTDQRQAADGDMSHLAGPAFPLYGTAKGVAADRTPVVQMHQVASVVAVKVANPSSAEVTLTRVAVEAPEEITGSFKVGFAGDALQLTAADASRTAAVSSSVSVPAGGTATFFLAVKPFTVTAGGKVVLRITGSDGDVAVEKSFPEAVSFRPGKIKTVNVEYAAADGKEYEYRKLISEPEDWEGEYVIGYTQDGVSAYILDGAGSNGNFASSHSVTLVDGKVACEDGDPYKVTVARSAHGYSLSLNGQYLGMNANANRLNFAASVSSENYEWTLRHDGENVHVQNVGFPSPRELQWNGSYLRFACYSDAVPVCLFKRVEVREDGGNTPVYGTVYTQEATDVASVYASLDATYSGLTTTNVQGAGFYYGTSADALNQEAYAEGPFTSPNGSFSVVLTSLEEETTYYFRAFMTVYDAAQGKYVDLLGTVRSFVTKKASGALTGLPWLDCYEVPGIDLNSATAGAATGNETFYETGHQTKWYKYATENDRQFVITHTYYYDNRVCRNYTVLYDTGLRCPLWTAQVMHADAYPDKNVGRQGSWTADPALSSSQQSSGATGSNNGTSSPYSRGHHCASADRQTTAAANKQTFYYTNQSPQYQNGFNDGVWSNLESAIQSHAPSGRDTLYVVTGTLFEDNATWPSNNGGTVGLPSHFYKCLMKCTFNTSGEMTAAKGVAYIYTNEVHSGVNYNAAAFRTTIDAIETRSGFDFFPRVPEDLQNTAEASSVSLW